MMSNQETKFDTVETLALIGSATAFWQSVDPAVLEAMCEPGMDDIGELEAHKAA
ncbi:hypothetical protein MUA02_04535 [Enterobacteriaceae bacterium H20N1]|uniref:Uncharacterized protein n=1 Tax=Dryocola boscaweniae TaxID=2925397 RepID=A0A9X3AA81_9ENTR|nr:hypothetical protein [Dryocola boscaweniae]MCT4701179.1 hypothetical protein [Dryocola boscaweniae]MCT4718316.1 hypothetical protein [Dryocola boscaweniae]